MKPANHFWLELPELMSEPPVSRKGKRETRNSRKRSQGTQKNHLQKPENQFRAVFGTPDVRSRSKRRIVAQGR